MKSQKIKKLQKRRRKGYKTYKKRTPKYKRRTITREYTTRHKRSKNKRKRLNRTLKRAKRGGTVLGPVLGILGGAGAASGIYWTLQSGGIDYGLKNEEVKRIKERTTKIKKRESLPVNQLHFYDDDPSNVGDETERIKYHLVKKHPDKNYIMDNGGLTVEQLRELIDTIEYTPDKVKSIVLDWDRTFSCTEGFGIGNSPDVLNYVNKQINFNINNYTNKLEFLSLKKHYELYKIYNHPNLQEKIKLGEEFHIGQDEDGNEIMRNAGYSEWKHNAVNSPKQLAQTYLLPYQTRNSGEYDVNNMDSIERIKLLTELFKRAYDKGKYIFILTNNKYSSKFLKEIMDTALNINFPIEHILRGGRSGAWKDGMTKYTVMIRPYWPTVDIYKILKIPQDNARFMISEYQYTIDFLTKKARAFELKVKDSRVNVMINKPDSYTNYLVDNIISIPNYEQGGLLSTIDKDKSEVFDEKLGEIKRQLFNYLEYNKKQKDISTMIERIKTRKPKKYSFGEEP
jgi:hypothetical protein